MSCVSHPVLELSLAFLIILGVEPGWNSCGLNNREQGLVQRNVYCHDTNVLMLAVNGHVLHHQPL